MSTATQTMTTLQAAQRYTARGWRCIPVPPRTKKPILDGWQELRLKAEDLPTHFSNGNNIGLLPGEPSGNLTDVDLDAPEAVVVAPAFLPPTALIHGRPSKRTSHPWYVTDQVVETTKFQFDEGRRGECEAKGKKTTVLVELRSTGSQTLVYPSVHPSGEQYAWEHEGEPARVSAADLTRRVRIVAACALLARHWPGEGSRHDAALSVAGMLLRAGWTINDADLFIVEAARAAGDEEAEDRKCAADTQAKLEAGDEEVTGRPRLIELLGDRGERVVATICKWWGLKTSGKASAQDAAGRGPSQASQLVALVSDAEFFHDADLTAWVTLAVASHHETWQVRSKSFRLFLEHRFYQATERTANSAAMQEALGALEGRARFDGVTQRVWVRLAEHQGAIYLDLADEAWRAVKMAACGWEVVGHPPVKFRRSKGMLPLPVPVRSRSLDALRHFVNVAPDKGDASD